MALRKSHLYSSLWQSCDQLRGGMDASQYKDYADFNDETKLGKGKEMQERLTKLVGIFEGLDFRANRGHGDDLLGDEDEYLSV